MKKTKKQLTVVLSSEGWPVNPESIDSLTEKEWVSYAAEMNPISEKAIRKYGIKGIDLSISSLDFHPISEYSAVFTKGDPETSEACKHHAICNTYDSESDDEYDDMRIDIFYLGVKGRFVIAMFEKDAVRPSFVDEFVIRKNKGGLSVAPLRIAGLDLDAYQPLPSHFTEETL